jgi:hypothetical protein
MLTGYGGSYHGVVEESSEEVIDIDVIERGKHDHSLKHEHCTLNTITLWNTNIALFETRTFVTL